MEAHFGCVRVRFCRIGRSQAGLGCVAVRFGRIGRSQAGLGCVAVRFGRIGHIWTGYGGLGGLGCGLGCHGCGHGCRIGVQRFDGTVGHFVDAAFDGDFHAVLFGSKRLKNGELAWQ